MVEFSDVALDPELEFRPCLANSCRTAYKADMTAIALLHREAILEQVRQGRVLREIAADYGIAKQSIHCVLHNDPEYRAALPIQAAAMIEEAKTEIWAARKPHDIARAREIGRWAMRYAESVDPARWAPRSQVTVEHVDRGERLRRARERVVGASLGASHDVSDADIVSNQIDKP